MCIFSEGPLPVRTETLFPASASFSHKLKSWAIEKSIVSWAIDKPRIGADHFYESGLNLNILKNANKTQIDNLILNHHSDFFIHNLPIQEFH